jgi:hypothetical protein
MVAELPLTSGSNLAGGMLDTGVVSFLVSMGFAAGADGAGGVGGV